MCNYVHSYHPKPNEVTIARRIRKKATEVEQINKLEFLLEINGRRFQANSTFLILMTMPDNKNIQIEGFPSFDMRILEEKIILSTYQIKLSESYMKDIEVKGKYWLIGDRLIADIEDRNIRLSLQKGRSKIIFIKVSSRHKRGKIIKNSNDKSANSSSGSEVDTETESHFDEEINEEKNTRSILRTEYRVFIHFKPNSKKAKGIKGIFKYRYLNLI